MAHDEPAASGAPTKLAIRNVGLMLSGDLDRPILDADAIVAVDGRIAAIGRAADLDSLAPRQRSTPMASRSRPGSSTATSIPSPAIGRRGRTNSTGSIPACMAASPR